MSAEFGGSVEFADWTFAYRGLRMPEKPKDCPWPYLIRRFNGAVWMILQLHHRTVTHRPSGDWLELTWSPEAPLERPWRWHAASGSRDLERLAEAFTIVRRQRRGRPRGVTDIRQPEDVPEAYLAVLNGSKKAPRQEQVAAKLGTTVRTLQRYRKKHGIPWPPI